MREMFFTEAINDALAEAMAADPNIVVFGEDIPMLRSTLLARFGPRRVRGTPISESAFIGMAVGAAMAGLRPVAEVWMVDFLGVCFDALLNQAAKVEAFSGGKWKAPMVVRAPYGGGYGDGGQHEQALWGMLAHIPGITVIVPSTPAEAGGLMTAALQEEGPVVFLESKLLSEIMMDFLIAQVRKTMSFDVPKNGSRGPVPQRWEALPIGKARVCRKGSDITLVSVGVGLHRSLEAAEKLQEEGVSAEVLDLRTISPLDKKSVCESAAITGRVLVIDEDYEGFGLSGEIAAMLAEAGIEFRYGRVCTQTTIPYNRELEDETLPNVRRIVGKAREMIN